METKLVEKGMNAPRDGLIVQARAHLVLEEKHREALSKCGWTPELTAELGENVALIESERTAALEARAESKAKLAREHEAISAAKALKRKLRYSFDDLYAEGAVTAEARRAIVGVGRLGRSSTKILGYLVDIEPRVREAEALLRPYFGGASALEAHAVAKETLAAAQSAQEIDYAHLPEETQKIYAAKGKALLLIEKMNRIAKLAFDGDALTMSLFNKDLILRARTSRAPEPVAEPA